MDALCHALIGALIVCLGVWFTHIRNAVNRSEMYKVINDRKEESEQDLSESESRYLSTLAATQSILGDMRKDVNQLMVDVGALKAISREKVR